MRTTAVWALTILLVTSCGGTDSDDTNRGDLTQGERVTVEPNGEDDSETIEPDDPDEVEAGPSLTAIHETFFLANGCTAGYCHAALGLASAEAVYTAFVNVEAPQPLCGRTHYVVPGDPEQSILWLRIRDTTPEDLECEVVKMPSGRTESMDPVATQLVYDWIAGGANP